MPATACYCLLSPATMLCVHCCLLPHAALSACAPSHVYLQALSACVPGHVCLQAFNAIISLSAIGLFISYAIPIFLRVSQARCSAFVPGPFSLGTLGVPVSWWCG